MMKVQLNVLVIDKCSMLIATMLQPIMGHIAPSSC